MTINMLAQLGGPLQCPKNPGMGLGFQVPVSRVGHAASVTDSLILLGHTSCIASTINNTVYSTGRQPTE